MALNRLKIYAKKEKKSKDVQAVSIVIYTRLGPAAGDAGGTQGLSSKLISIDLRERNEMATSLSLTNRCTSHGLNQKRLLKVSNSWPTFLTSYYNWLIQMCLGASSLQLAGECSPSDRHMCCF